MLPALESDDSSEGSLLASPAQSDGEDSLLVTPYESEDETSTQATKTLQQNSTTADIVRSDNLDVTEEIKVEELLHISQDERKISAKATASQVVVVKDNNMEIQVPGDEQPPQQRRSPELAVADFDDIIETPQNIWQDSRMMEGPTPKKTWADYIPESCDQEYCSVL